MARIQQNTVTVADTLDCDILFMDNQTNAVVLGRQHRNVSLTTVSTINVSPPVETTNDFRLFLSVRLTLASRDVRGELLATLASGQSAGASLDESPDASASEPESIHAIPGHAWPHDFSPLHPVQQTSLDAHVVDPHGTPGPLSDAHWMATHLSEQTELPH